MQFSTDRHYETCDILHHTWTCTSLHKHQYVDLCDFFFFLEIMVFFIEKLFFKVKITVITLQ